MLEENALIFLSVDISILLDGSTSFVYLFFFGLWLASPMTMGDSRGYFGGDIFSNKLKEKIMVYIVKQGNNYFFSSIIRVDIRLRIFVCVLLAGNIVFLVNKTGLFMILWGDVGIFLLG